MIFYLLLTCYLNYFSPTLDPQEREFLERDYRVKYLDCDRSLNKQ